MGHEAAHVQNGTKIVGAVLVVWWSGPLSGMVVGTVGPAIAQSRCPGSRQFSWVLVGGGRGTRRCFARYGSRAIWLCWCFVLAAVRTSSPFLVVSCSSARAFSNGKEASRLVGDPRWDSVASWPPPSCSARTSSRSAQWYCWRAR